MSPGSVISVEHVKPLVSAKAHVVFLGDGEFDGVNLQRTITKYHWDYVCHTGDNIKVFQGGQELSCAEVACRVQPGERITLSDVLFTHEKYGPVTLIGWWRKGYREPILLVTNIALPEVAYTFYSKRFRIETFFSDQKSRGSNLHKSHISDPQRLSRLLITACLAYIWVVYLGVLCIKEGSIKTIHRAHRCDLRLFQLGLRLLDQIA